MKPVIEVPALYNSIREDMGYGPTDRVCRAIFLQGLRQGNPFSIVAAEGSDLPVNHTHTVPLGDYESQSEEVLELSSHTDSIVHLHRRTLLTTDAWQKRQIAPQVIATLHGPSENVNKAYENISKKGLKFTVLDEKQLDGLNEEFDVVALIENGVDTNYFMPNFKSVKESIVCLGRICREKGQADAIRVASLADMKLVMAGPVTDTAYFRKEILPYVDGDLIKFLGTVSTSQIRNLLDRAVCLIHPIHWEDPAPLVVLEAQSMGVPVVAYGRGGLPRQIKNGVTGYLVSDTNEAVDAVNEVIGLDRENIRKWTMRNFDWSIISKKYFRLFQDL